MDAFRNFLVLFSIVLITFENANGDCSLSLLTDYGIPSPVFTRNDVLLMPNNRGSVVLRKDESIVVGCPGKLVKLGKDTTKYNTVDAKCIEHQTFGVEGKEFLFKDITCNNLPTFTSKTNCYNGGYLYRIGYQIKSEFHTLYEACFNRDLLTTYYVKHYLAPSSRYSMDVPRPEFTEGNLFGGVNMWNVYKGQPERLNKILGPNDYIKKAQKLYLTRGHLAARADYSLGAQMDATFHYVNTAPQWLIENDGAWNDLEKALRIRVNNLGRSVTVYSGTHEVLFLEDKKQRRHPIYLSAEAGKQRVPVPMYFYKIIYDPVTKKSTAFVSINSPFYNAATIKSLTFCTNVCADKSKFGWLNWQPGTVSFCCNYQEFTKKINYLDLNWDVNDLFY